jgi:hypothetical protein
MRHSKFDFIDADNDESRVPLPKTSQEARRSVRNQDRVACFGHSLVWRGYVARGQTKF